jgi:hypothetical protein
MVAGCVPHLLRLGRRAGEVSDFPHAGGEPPGQQRSLGTDHCEWSLTRFPPDIGELGGLALAASKTHLYFTLRKDVGDIWVMDVVADDER